MGHIIYRSHHTDAETIMGVLATMVMLDLITIENYVEAMIEIGMSDNLSRIYRPKTIHKMEKGK